MGLSRDLAQHAHPVGEFLSAEDRENNAANRHRVRLADAELQRYAEDGFVVSARPVLTEAQLLQLEAELDALADPTRPHPKLDLLYEHHYNETGDSGNAVFHCLGHWRVSEGFHDVCFLPAVTVPASQLLGGRTVRLWHDQLFAKPARFGGCVQWHQDYSYWQRSRPMQHVTVHIALDDQDAGNGGVTYVPGSHAWTRGEGQGQGPLPPAAVSNEAKGKVDDPSFTAEMDRLKTVLTEAELAHWKAKGERCADVRRGHAIWHHPLVVHGSYPNRSDRRRRAVVLNYFADGTVCAVAGCVLKGVPDLAAGEAFKEPFFPVVYKP